VFRDVGVPDALVDRADDVLRPIVDAGYVRHDKSGDTRPYLYDGAIHRNVQSQQLARQSSPKPSHRSRHRERHAGELLRHRPQPLLRVGVMGDAARRHHDGMAALLA
jgi:hypothetical protein